MGAYMAHHALVPDRALVSPSRRTRQTWEGVAAGLPNPVPVTYEDLLYDAKPETILSSLREIEPEVTRLLLIGHNPGLHEIARLLIASGDVEAREQINEALPTTGFAVIEFAVHNWDELHPSSGRLERFVTPRLLKTTTD